MALHLCIHSIFLAFLHPLACLPYFSLSFSILAFFFNGGIRILIITHYAEIDLFYLRSSITSSLDGAPRERSSRKVHAIFGAESLLQ